MTPGAIVFQKSLKPNLLLGLNCLGFGLRQPYVELCRTLRAENRTKIINTRINFIREQIRMWQICLLRTDKNVADMFTKPVPNEKLEEHRDKVMNGFRGLHPIIDHEVIFTLNNIDIEYYID